MLAPSAACRSVASPLPCVGGGAPRPFVSVPALRAAARPRPEPLAALAADSSGLGSNPARALLEMGNTMSVDPLQQAQKPDDVYEPGKTWTVHSPEEFQSFLQVEDRLVVLMCKAKSCRPCKMFSRKFARIAQRNPQVVFLEVYGDESAETRKMMIAEEIRVTPTFLWYRGQERVHSSTGVNENKLNAALSELCDDCVVPETA